MRDKKNLLSNDIILNIYFELILQGGLRKIS